MSTETQGTSEATASAQAQPRGIRWSVAIVLVVWTIALYVAETGGVVRFLNADTVMYNQSGAVRNHGVAAGAALWFLGLIVYITPAVLGAMARSWPGALAFVLVPMWLVILPVAGANFAGSMPGSLIYGNGPFSLPTLSAPLWLDATRATPLILSAEIFAIFASVGWLARVAWLRELRPTR